MLTWLCTVFPMKKVATSWGMTFWRSTLLAFSMVSISSLSILKHCSSRKSTRLLSSSWQPETRRSQTQRAHSGFGHEEGGAWTHLSSQDQTHHVEDHQPDSRHDLRVLQDARPAHMHTRVTTQHNVYVRERHTCWDTKGAELMMVTYRQGFRDLYLCINNVKLSATFTRRWSVYIYGIIACTGVLSVHTSVHVRIHCFQHQHTCAHGSSSYIWKFTCDSSVAGEAHIA